MAARLDDPHHLFDALRHVWKRHNAELGSRYVEAIISELECVAIHDTCLDFEPLLARSRTEQVEHDGDWSVAITSALRRDTQGTAARCHVQKPHACPELGRAEAFVAKPHLRRSIGLIVA